MGCSCSKSTKGNAPPQPANAFLPYYTVADLAGQEVFGPFLGLRSHDPDTGRHVLSVLMVCTEAAQQRIQAEPKITWTDQGSSGAGQSAAGELLYTWRNWRFWRFLVTTACGETSMQLKYGVGLLPNQLFKVAVPARDQTWNWAFFSCNGLENRDNKDKTGGMQPLWKDLLARHADRPLHVIVGGGDQVYNDAVFDGPLLQGWDHTLSISETKAKVAIPFSAAMREEVEEFYFSHYAAHFSQPLLSLALASIPSVNIWDDHDIFDGWGSYPNFIMRAQVMQGVFAAARLFYHLFQLHSTPDTAAADGCWSGTSRLLRFGASTAVVLPDTRTFRSIEQICPPSFYEELRGRLEALPYEVRHVVVVLTVPILWPKPDVLQAVQDISDVATRNQYINNLMNVTGLFRSIPTRFGAVEVLDDLLDHWDSKSHVQERDALLDMLGGISAAKGFRVTFLSGDVHCAGHGMYHSRCDVAKEEVACMDVPDEDARTRDPWVMYQVVSSAITNVPPPSYVIAALQQAGAKPKPILQDCVERMLPVPRHLHLGFEDGDDMLVAERNWCEVAQEGGPAGKMVFAVRCEKKLGSGSMHTFKVEVPPLVLQQTPPPPQQQQEQEDEEQAEEEEPEDE